MADVLQLEPKKTALVLIDLQNAIVSRDLAPHKASDVVARSAKLAEAMRAAGGTVVYVHALMGEFVSRLTDVQRPSMGTLPPGASDIVPEAGMQKSDIVIAKRSWGAFHATSLDQQLRRRGVDTIIMAGIATNMGVESTARCAQDHDYQLVFAEDAMSSMGEALHEFAVKKLFPLMGRVRSTEEILSTLR